MRQGGAAVVLGHDEQQRVGQQRMQLEVVVEVEPVARLGEDEGGVQLPGAQAPQQDRQLALDEGHLHPVLSHGLHRRGQQQGARRGEGADVQGVRAALGQVPDLAFGEPQPFEDGLRVREQCRSELGQRGATGPSSHQTGVEVRFEDPEVVGDGGLCVVQRAGGGRERALWAMAFRTVS